MFFCVENSQCGSPERQLTLLVYLIKKITKTKLMLKTLSTYKSRGDMKVKPGSYAMPLKRQLSELQCPNAQNDLILYCM